MNEKVNFRDFLYLGSKFIGRITSIKKMKENRLFVTR